MHGPVRRHRSNRPALVALAAVIGAGISADALAQDARRMIAIQEDDSGGRAVMNVSMPDLFELREPDFTRQDMHTLDKLMSLTESQRTIIFALHDAYLTAFFDAMKAMGIPIEPQRLGMIRGGDGIAPQPGEGRPPGEPVGITIGGLDGDIAEALREAGIDGPVAIGVSIDVEGGHGGGAIVAVGEGDAEHGGDAADAPGDVAVIEESIDDSGEEDGPVPDGPPAPRVAISLDAGEDVPDEVREQLEKIAQQLQEQALHQIEQQGAWQDENGQAFPMPPMMPGGAENFEEMQQRMKELEQKADEFAREKKWLRDQFVGDVQAQLSFEQVALWPGYERKLTRDKTLPKGRLDGERTDLLRIVDQLQLDDEAAADLNDITHGYEIALNDALVRRNDFLAENRRKIDQLLNEGEGRKALSLVDRATELRVAVRSLNEQYLDQFAQALPAGRAESFRQAALRSFYPRVYRQTRAQTAFDAAAKIEGNSPEVAKAVEELRSAYGVELVSVNESLRQAIREHQPGEARHSIEHMAQVIEGADHGPPPMLTGDDPIRAALDKRSELDERYMKQLYSMFTDEQVAKLPKLPSQVRAGQPVMFRAVSPN